LLCNNTKGMPNSPTHNSLLHPIIEEQNSNQSEEAVFQEYNEQYIQQKKTEIYIPDISLVRLAMVLFFILCAMVALWLCYKYHLIS